ncbi:MAG TPA: pantoate--beta-alanine ligase, partial [Acidimicrobiales bacterium]|nr:pantoate--beta-alanine ligase [Acidimicrobiales bacterium]
AAVVVMAVILADWLARTVLGPMGDLLAVTRRLQQGDLSARVDPAGPPEVAEVGVAVNGLAERVNVLLAAEREAAADLYRALARAVQRIEGGERDAAALRREMADVAATNGLVELDYAAVVRAADLGPVDPVKGDVRVLVAARVGSTRLIDNVGVTVPALAGARV